MKKIFFAIGLMLIIFSLPSPTISSTAICKVPYADGCCSQYSSDYRWPSGAGMCCGGMPYYNRTYCPSSEAQCSGVSCPSYCEAVPGTGGIANTNGWCVNNHGVGECKYYRINCDDLDKCVGDNFINYGCSGGSCIPVSSDSCADCNCVNEAGEQQTCGNYNLEESIFVNPELCFDGKDNDCDGKCDTYGCNSMPPDEKCGILIRSISDIQNYCQYFPNTHTYYCTEKVNWAGGGSIKETDGIPVFGYPPGTTFSQKSYSGTFDGANPLTITAGGNCDPKDEEIEVTGICEGVKSVKGGCISVPKVTGKRGLFLKHRLTMSCSYIRYDCGSCSVTGTMQDGTSCTASGRGYGRSDVCCAYKESTCWATATCSKETNNNLEGTSVSITGGGSCSVSTYYHPCTLNPTVKVNGMLFQYSGLVNNTTTATLPLANFKTGANTLEMSAQESGRFNYTVKWTEVTSPTGSCTVMQRTKAYRITGNVYQSGEDAEIFEGKFSMKFDSADTDTSISLLRDDTNAIVSARISKYDATNLKLELYNSTHWTLLANNIQPNTWYNFSITLDERLNTVTIYVTSVGYPAIGCSVMLMRF